MARDDAAQEVLILSEKLRKWQYEYYVLAKPSISDAEFDAQFNRLVELEESYPELKSPDSPTTRVGSDLSSDLPDVDHTIPVLSLDKVYSAQELISWIEKTEHATEGVTTFIFEEKIDGVSIVLYYESGSLARAVTRGNGSTGNDVTANIKTIGSVPLVLPEPVTVAVRGEIYLPLKGFEELNAGLEVPYANPRNFAAGSIRRIKSADVAPIPLEIFTYEGFFSDEMADHIAIMERLEAYGFKLNNRIAVISEMGENHPSASRHSKWFYGTNDDIDGYVESMTRDRLELDYEIDGLVVKVNEIAERAALGYTGHHPRWSMAFKFESPQGVTRVREIDVQVGRTGRITPVARVEPVKIGGSTVSNVTLHNQEYINLLELAVGDVVAVSKRGDVIPAVEEVLEKNEVGNAVWVMPEMCPSCSAPLIDDGAHRFCRNPECPEQKKGRVFFFIGNGQMDIDNLGPETAGLLMDRGDISGIADIYRFDYTTLHGVPGFGERKIALIQEGVEKSKNQPFSVVLPALGIPELGQKAVELMIQAGYRTIDEMIGVADRGAVDELTAIHGLGEKTAAAIIAGLSDPGNRELIDELRESGLRFTAAADEYPTAASGVFSGQTWCVTGSFDTFKPRTAAMDEVKKLGGRVTGSVTGKTTHLLAGEGAGSKLKKAQELGVVIVSEDEFLELMRS